MPKSATTFRPVGDSERRMPGTPALILAGFSVGECATVRALLDGIGLASLPLAMATAARQDETLAALAATPERPDASNGPAVVADGLPRAVIMSGFSERELNACMDAYRQAALPRALWATVTAHSGDWPLRRLLTELQREREALRQARLKQADTTTPPAS